MTRHLSVLAIALIIAPPAFALDKVALPAPITDADYSPVNPAEAKLGQLPFWDPILFRQSQHFLRHLSPHQIRHL